MIRFVLRYFMKYRYTLILMIIFSICTFSLNLVIPYTSGHFLDLLISDSSKSEITNMALLIFILMLLSTLLKSMIQILSAKLNINSGFEINYDVVEHLKKVDILYLKSYQPSYLTQRVNNDANEISLFVLANLITVFTQMGTIIISFVILFKISASIGLILIIVIPIYSLIYIKFRKPIYNASMIFKEKLNGFFGNLTSQFEDVKLIKANVTFDNYASNLVINFEYVKSAFYKMNNLNIISTGIDDIIKNIAVGLIYFFGGLEVFKGNISIGNFSILVVYFNMILQCLSYFLEIGKKYQGALVSYNRICEYLDLEVENQGTLLVDGIDTIQIKNLGFGYRENTDLYNNLNITFEKGKIYLLKGENGTGKSTLIDIITGLIYKDYKGEVLISNNNIKNIDLYHFRENYLSILYQSEIVSNISAYDNITEFGRYTNLETAKEIANVVNFKNELLETDSLRVQGFSGGEKQKLGIIKTLLKDKPILIMDEPTSALDYESKINLINYLQCNKTNKIIIIISHDIDVLGISDEVINLSK